MLYSRITSFKHCNIALLVYNAKFVCENRNITFHKSLKDDKMACLIYLWLCEVWSRFLKAFRLEYHSEGFHRISHFRIYLNIFIIITWKKMWNAICDKDPKFGLFSKSFEGNVLELGFIFQRLKNLKMVPIYMLNINYYSYKWEGCYKVQQTSTNFSS